MESAATIVSKVYARVGLLGNPSDGFHGKTISFSLSNFYAQVELQPSATVSFVPHSFHDQLEYQNLDELLHKVEGQGYYGGIRLLMATCKRFTQFCRQKGIPLESKGFTLSYDTNIPRQTGLSGSSGIVCAALNCLMKYFGVEQQIPLVERPALVLSAEQELGITAGLQDRVIQVYGGLVFMDFDEQHMQQLGHGQYTQLAPSLLPPLHLVYCENPSESGKVHSAVKQRWLSGEQLVRELMQQVAQCAEQGRAALEAREHGRLFDIMNRNFDLRRQLFGDAALGATNLRMVETARSVGAAAKFTGSGGAIIAYCPQGEQQVAALREACAREGFTVVLAEVGPENCEVMQQQ